MAESVQLEGVDMQQVGLVIEAAERRIDTIYDLDIKEEADQYLEAYEAVKAAYNQANN